MVCSPLVNVLRSALVWGEEGRPFFCVRSAKYGTEMVLSGTLRSEAWYSAGVHKQLTIVNCQFWLWLLFYVADDFFGPVGKFPDDMKNEFPNLCCFIKQDFTNIVAWLMIIFMCA